MTYTAAQRRHQEARHRALLQQEQRARAAVPAGLTLAPGAVPTKVPMGRYSWSALADMLGVREGLAGFVLAASCRASVFVYGASYPHRATVRAWGVGAYRSQPRDTIEIRAEGRGAGPLSTAKLFPLVKGGAEEPLRTPDLDSNGLPSPEPAPFPWLVDSA